MSILDTIAPQRGPKRRRFGIVFIAKTTFYTSVAGLSVFFLASFLLFDSKRELELIPATRVESEVLAPVYDYLKSTDVSVYSGTPGQFDTLNCWTEFGDQQFSAEYLNLGSWRVNAFYDQVRYYWRVDDLSLEVTRDAWVKSENRTIPC